MSNQYPIKFTTQLRQHLRALRKTRGLTQAQLGELVGVSQARIAEIEANPGLVSFDQLMQLFAILDVTVTLNEEARVPESENVKSQITSEEGMRRQLQNSVNNNVNEQIRQQIEKTLKSAGHNTEIEKILQLVSKTKQGNW